MSGTSKVKLLSINSVAIFGGRTESRDLICIRHTYPNDKICKPIGLLKSYDNRKKAVENRPPPDFWAKELTGPCLNFLELLCISFILSWSFSSSSESDKIVGSPMRSANRPFHGFFQLLIRTRGLLLLRCSFQ